MNPSFIVYPSKMRKNNDYKDYLVVSVKCPHCKDKHSHGIHKDAKDNQHRVADCGKGNYYITLNDGRST